MNTLPDRIKESISRLSEEEIIQMVYIDSAQYRDDAITFGKKEIARRGLATVAQKYLIIDSIGRKMKFLRTYKRFFDYAELMTRTVEDLKQHDEMLTISVKAHSNPLLERRIKALYRNNLELDPRWQPFFSFLTAVAAHRPMRSQRQSCRALIAHLTKSDILANYVLSMIQISPLAIQSGEELEPFHKASRRLFKRAGLEYLLDRAPMAFTYDEGFAVKVIMQVCRNPDPKSQKEVSDVNSYMHMALRMNKDTEREYIKPPRLVNKIFGSEEDYRMLSLREYGEHFIKVFTD